MKHLSITIIILLMMPVVSKSQTLPNRPKFSDTEEWYGSIMITSNSMLTTLFGKFIVNPIWNYAIAKVFNNTSMLEMDFPTRIHVPPYKMYDTYGDVMEMGSPKWWKNWFWNWNYNFEISPSYEITWIPRAIPRINLIAGVGYEYKQLYFQNGFLEGRHKTHACFPTAALQYYLLNPTKNDFNIIVEAGASYIYNIKYKNPQDYSLEALNNGIRGRFRLMIGNTQKLMLIFQYEHDFYNYFNHNYSPDGGVSFPLDGIKNSFGAVYLQVLAFNADWLKELSNL